MANSPHSKTMNPFIKTITSQEAQIRDESFQELCSGLSVHQTITFLRELEEFRKKTPNLYEKVRASIFLYAGFRFCLLDSSTINAPGKIPIEGYKNLLDRNFEKAISIFHSSLHDHTPLENLFSCLAECYHQ